MQINLRSKSPYKVPKKSIYYQCRTSVILHPENERVLRCHGAFNKEGKDNAKGAPLLYTSKQHVDHSTRDKWTVYTQSNPLHLVHLIVIFKLWLPKKHECFK